MKSYLRPFALLLVLTLSLCHAACKAAETDNTAETHDTEPTKEGPLTIRPLTHGSVLLEWKELAVYIDPAGTYDWASLPKADLILITHEHGDHASSATVAKIRKTETQIVANAGAARQFPGATVMKNGDERELLGIGIQAVPSYNVVRKSYHPKGRDNGYVLTFNDVRAYLAGDTEAIPEMADLQEIDIAFLPINLPFTMPPSEAATAARMFKPRILYPYHQGTSDPEELKELLSDLEETEVRVRELP
jgi:L-ascorbate metabolism protein UlaG (beta-lactamase superfamily)